MSSTEGLQTFIAESRDLLQIMEMALICVAERKIDADMLHGVHDAATRIKTGARQLGLPHVVGFVHLTESVLRKLCERNRPLHRGALLLLSACVEHAAALVDDVDNGLYPCEDVQRRCDALSQDLFSCLEQWVLGETHADRAPVVDAMAPVGDAMVPRLPPDTLFLPITSALEERPRSVAGA